MYCDNLCVISLSTWKWLCIEWLSLLVSLQAQQYVAMTRGEKVQVRSRLLLERWKFYFKVQITGVSLAIALQRQRNS